MLLSLGLRDSAQLKSFLEPLCTIDNVNVTTVVSLLLSNIALATCDSQQPVDSLNDYVHSKTGSTPGQRKIPEQQKISHSRINHSSTHESSSCACSQRIWR